LPAGVVVPVAVDEGTAREQLAHPGGDRDLAGLAAGLVEFGDERVPEPVERLDRHGGGDVRVVEQGGGVVQGERGLGAGDRGAVQQGGGVLGAERDARDAGGGHGLLAAHHAPVEDRLARVPLVVLGVGRAAQHDGDVGEGDQVAGRAERAVFRYGGQ